MTPIQFLKRFSINIFGICLKISKFPDLKVTADLSHFFVVLSNTLDDEMETIKTIGNNCFYIHSRVGYDNGTEFLLKFPNRKLKVLN